jgi:hypothetical protein
MTALGAQALSLPARAHQVESDPNPRQTLDQVVQDMSETLIALRLA